MDNDAEANAVPRESEVAEPPPAPPHFAPAPWGRAVLGALLSGFTFALLGALWALRTAATAVLPHILTPSDQVAFQDLTDGLPVPGLLDWNLTLIHFLYSLSELNMGMRVALACIVGGIALLVAIRILNPTFQPLRFVRVAPTTFGGRRPSDPQPAPSETEDTTPDPEPLLPDSQSPTPPEATHLAVTANGRHLAKLVLLLLLIGIPLGAFWAVVARREGINLAEWVSYSAALGICLAFQRFGLAGNFDDRGLRWHRYLPLLIVPAAFAGFFLYTLTWWLQTTPLDSLLFQFHMLGTFHRGYFAELVGRYLATLATLSFVLGSGLYALGNPRLSLVQRAALCIVPALAFSSAQQFYRPFEATRMAAERDITLQTDRAVPRRYSLDRPGSGIPNGPLAGRELAQRAGLNIGTQPGAPDHDVLYFGGEGLVTERQKGISSDGLSVELSSVPKVKAFLEKRNYRTALSWAAIKHLFNVATFHWDTTTAIETFLTDLTRCPHAALTQRAVRIMLATCSAAPENSALLDRLGEETQFTFLDRESKRMMGDLYRRMGQKEKALLWYRRAEMPKSFLARTEKEPPRFHIGRVSGVLSLNGKPMAGMRVAVLPLRLEGLPRDLENVLQAAWPELSNVNSNEPLFPPFHPYPRAFRWLSASATTDAGGRFTLEHLTEGNYMLLCALPPDVSLQLPTDAAVVAANAPGPFGLSPKSPTKDLKTIALRIRPERIGQKSDSGFAFTPSEAVPAPPNSGSNLR